MKRLKTPALLLALILAALALFASCAKYSGNHEADWGYGYPDAPAATAKYKSGVDEGPAKNYPAETIHIDENNVVTVKENPFVSASAEPVSTFSADVDTASYTYFRRLVNNGYKLSELISTAGSALRTEEMVNYFKYDCPAPDGTLFGVKATLAPSPYNESLLLMLTLQTEKTEPQTKNNLVFLIDVSGSMYSDDKLPLLKQAFRYLVDRLDADDVISIVTYSGKEEVVLEGCPGSKKELILNAIDALEANGSTNGEAGLKKAYEIAEKYFIPGGSNRIFMASDGDLNVGISSPEELKNFVSDKKDSGVYLSVLGFGSRNYRDANMEAVADNGNGVYLYIDGPSEAEKVFSTDLFANLYAVADDVKLQLTFNQNVVRSYRLVGYENRVLNKEDFENDAKDAGELGAGHQVTVFYEIIPEENVDLENLLSYSTDRYDVLASLAVRSKQPGDDKSVEETYVIPSSVYTSAPGDDFAFAAAVVECSAILRNSEYKGDASLEHLASVLSKINVSDDPSKEEFQDLVNALLKRG